MINPINISSSNQFSSPTPSKKTSKNTPATDPQKTAEEVVKVILGQQNTKKAAENLGVSVGTTLRIYITYAKKVCVMGNPDISNFNCSVPLLQKIVDKYNEITKNPPIKLIKSTKQKSKPASSHFSSSSTSSSREVTAYKDTSNTNIINKNNEKDSNKPASHLGKRKLRDPSEDDRESNDSADKDDLFSLTGKEQAQSSSSLSGSLNLGDELLFMANNSINPSQIPIPETDELDFYNVLPDELANNDSDELMNTSDSHYTSISPPSISESDSSLNPSPEVEDLFDLSPSVDFENDFSLTNEDIQSEGLGIYSKDLQEKETLEDFLLFLDPDTFVPPQPSLPEEDELGLYNPPKSQTYNNESLDEPLDEPMAVPPQSNSVSSSSSPSSKAPIIDNLLPLSSHPSPSLPTIPAIAKSSSSTPSKPSMQSTKKLSLNTKKGFEIAKKDLIDNPSNPTKVLDKFTVSDLVDIYQQCKAKIQETIDSTLSSGTRLPKSYPLHMIDALVQPNLANKYGFDVKTFTIYKNALINKTEDKYARINKNIIKAARLIKEGLDVPPPTIAIVLPNKTALPVNKTIEYLQPKEYPQPKKITPLDSKWIDYLANNPFIPINNLLNFTSSDLVAAYKQWKQQNITAAKLSDESIQPQHYPLLIIDALVEQSPEKRKILADQYGFNKKSFQKYRYALKYFMNGTPILSGNKVIISAAAMIIEESNKKNSTDSAKP